MKELRLSKEEGQLVATARLNGFEQWSYRSWRLARTVRGKLERFALTKSIANKGEWSFIREEAEAGVRTKVTTKDIGRLMLLISANRSII